MPEPLDRTPAHLADMLEFVREPRSTARDQLPDLPWRQVIGLRNILAHGYEQVAHETLYRTRVEDLPALEASLARAQRADA